MNGIRHHNAGRIVNARNTYSMETSDSWACDGFLKPQQTCRDAEGANVGLNKHYRNSDRITPRCEGIVTDQWTSDVQCWARCRGDADGRGKKSRGGKRDLLARRAWRANILPPPPEHLLDPLGEMNATTSFARFLLTDPGMAASLSGSKVVM